MKDVIIIGGGYSVKEGIEKGLWDKIKGKEVWSLNYAFKFMSFLPTRELWVDPSFFFNNIAEIQKLSDSGVSLHCRENIRYDNFIYKDKLNTYPVTSNFNEHKTKIYRGTSLGLVGTFALSLACREKYDIIYLLGYDFGPTSSTDKNTHFYVDKVDELKIISTGVNRPEVYYENTSIKSQVTDYDNYKTAYDNKIYNVSLASNIHSFKKIGYDEFFNFIEAK